MKLKKGYKSWKNAEKELSQNPEVKAEFDKLELEYQLASSLIGARIKRNMTQAQLAKQIGTKQPVISRIESMSSSPSVTLLKRVAVGLGAKLEIRFAY